MDSPHSASSHHVDSCKDNEHHNFPWTWSGWAWYYVSLLLLTPKILSLPFDPQDNAFLSWAYSYTAFHTRSNCWFCRVLLSSLWKAFHGGHLHFKERTFSKSANTFDNNPIWCLFLVWWHLTILKWTGEILGTLTEDITWLLTLPVVPFLLFAPCICNCVTGFVSSHMKAFKLQMVSQSPATVAASSNYYLGPLDQRPSVWGLGKYVTSPI